ncbi:MAG: hypothetical protein ACI86H_001995 [bacterium]|jgi:hypothetical protein
MIRFKFKSPDMVLTPSSDDWAILKMEFDPALAMGILNILDEYQE